MTLIEILISVALGAIVVAIAFGVMNPGGMFASARNSERTSELQAIMTAIKNNIADSRTGFSCASGEIPTTTPKNMGSSVGDYDIAPCLVPEYMDDMPFDPTATGAHYTSNSDYSTGYTIIKNASTSQITLAAPFAEQGKTISLTK